MLARNNPDRIRIAFDDHRLVAQVPACSCRPLSPGTWACGNSSTITLTSAARRDGGQAADAGRLRPSGPTSRRH